MKSQFVARAGAAQQHKTTSNSPSVASARVSSLLMSMASFIRSQRQTTPTKIKRCNQGLHKFKNTTLFNSRQHGKQEPCNHCNAETCARLLRARSILSLCYSTRQVSMQEERFGLVLFERSEWVHLTGPTDKDRICTQGTGPRCTVRAFPWAGV